MGFRLANVNGRAVLSLHMTIYDLQGITAGEFSSCPMEAIARFDELTAIDLEGKEPTATLDPSTLGPPVPRPSKVFGIGLNYRLHAEESGLDIPDVPLVFTKFPSCLVGPTADIELRGDACDWEVELVVVMGRGGRDIAEADAWDHVAGLTAGQDISDRRVQMAAKPPQFSMGKSFDTFGPIGPWLVSLDAFENPDNVRLKCSVNGEVKQDGATDDLIFSVPQLIAYLSSISTLEPGDLIFTGTPSGVGSAAGTYLSPGDEILTEIEGIGELRNRCVASS